MKVVRIISGDPPRLDVTTAPTPTPGPRQALVRIAASGLNRADLLQLAGHYQVPADAPPDIPGLEFAGTIEEVGPHCSRVVRGKRVFGLCGGGAHAQFIVSPEELLMAVPSRLSDVEAAAIPETFITAHDALVTQANMEAGERVLIHAIGSGVGVAALQLASAWDCETFGTARSQSKIDAAMRLSTDPAFRLGHLFACAPDVFDKEILRLTGGEGVDIILDPVGGAYFDRNLNAIALRGRLVIIATLGGATATLPLPVLMNKRLRLIGTMLRTRTLLEKAAATRAFERDVMPKLVAGDVRPVVDRTFPLEEVVDAYAYLAENRNFGKVVLTMT
jgi:putative PIG3 family NAD(P)H quinone oxidoreductase